MSSTTINTWMAQEKVAFENFNEFIALRLEDGIFRSLAEGHLQRRGEGQR